MRVAGFELKADEPTLAFTFDGERILARPGETVAAALTAVGIRDLRVDRDGLPRGLYCGMGVCQDCLVEINGEAAVPACMTKVTGNADIKRHVTPSRRLGPPPAPQPLGAFTASPDVLVIGGGPAGLMAAIASARAGAVTALVDERPVSGGQYFKQPHAGLAHDTASDDSQFAEGRGLIRRAKAAGIAFIEGVVIDAPSAGQIVIVTHGQRIDITPTRLVIATGAYERPRPVPGWTLPGVMTIGAAQTLLRSYGVLPGRRILVAGNGPLNLQVAVELARAGADIVAVCESAPSPQARHLAPIAAMALTSPELTLQGWGYLRELRRRSIPVHYGTGLAGIRPGLSAHWVDAQGSRRDVEVDCVCMGYGFLPSNQLLRLLDCRHDYDERHRQLVTVRDTDLRTTVANVFAVGDCCGLGGARAAMAEGTIAGMIAAAEARGTRFDHGQQSALSKVRRALKRHRRFQAALWQVFAPLPLPDLRPDDCLICRCESVAASAVTSIVRAGSDSIGSLKRQSRLGMGRCQGRYCIPEAVECLSRIDGTLPNEYSFAAPRPPIKPVPIGVLQAIDRRECGGSL
jgi:NADPH-dependent 2,4-dienoyl-CoA reductase/sulfur reductase-like enzyme